MQEKLDIKNYLLPGRIRKKDGYYHLIIDTIHPITKEKIRHSESTKLKVIEESKRKNLENENEAKYRLKIFREKWSKYHFSDSKDKTENIYFTDYLSKWLNNIKHTLQPSTIESYTLNIQNIIIPYFKSKNFLLKDLKARHIQEFYTNCLEKRKISSSTIRRYHANIRKCLQTALKQELVLSNQADLVDKPKEKKYIANVLKISDLLNILENLVGTHLELPTFFSTYYGLRRGEAAGLLWSNIDFKNKKIIIGNTLIEGENKELINRKSLKTKSSYRTLELIPQVEKFLLEIKEKQEENKKHFKGSYNYKYSDNICVKENGELIKLDYITKKFKEITKRLGYEDVHFHCLRHSFATNMYNAGMDMKDIQKWLGHSALSTTMDLYVHFFEKRIKESAKILENAMKNGKGEKEEIENNDKK
ncbi:tyrosine-type recombinase/integrase [uncultured Fusobacterium sp.]|uniref:tyrosine-type recombinase/integrase n=1 Tax=uncultured Fusobacterium sp. TaxID=159267 RepID=UPI0025E38077|nr:tyrosine-type recombinase/integrase [uncultured Fusobacterium sp.]